MSQLHVGMLTDYRHASRSHIVCNCFQLGTVLSTAVSNATAC